MRLGASYHMDYSSGASPVQKVVELMSHRQSFWPPTAQSEEASLLVRARQTMVAEGKKEIQAEKARQFVPHLSERLLARKSQCKS